MHTEKRVLLWVMLLSLFPGLSSVLAAPASPDQIDIPFQKYVLDNGLTLILHEDHKAPIVAVNVWYHVGSKNERSARPASPTSSST